MITIPVAIAALIVLLFVTRYLTGRNHLRELGRDFSIELPIPRDRALAVAANAADGVVWRLSMTDNGLFTRHGFAHNVIHVLVSDHPRAQSSSTVKVWARCPDARDSILFGRPTAYQ